MRAIVFSSLLLAACGAAQTDPVSPEPSAPTATERGCFSGSHDNGVCEVFSAAREPLSLVAAHCRASGGRWLATCPSEGRVGACHGDGQQTVYYGLGLDRRELQRRCEAEGHAFVP